MLIVAPVRYAPITERVASEVPARTYGAFAMCADTAEIVRAPWVPVIRAAGRYLYDFRVARPVQLYSFHFVLEALCLGGVVTIIKARPTAPA